MTVIFFFLKVNDYNILLVDAPLGTGFSVKSSDDTNDNIDQNGE